MLLVTGATGHIGNVLVKALIERGHKVRIFVLPNDDLTPVQGLDLDIHTGDIRDYAAVRKAVAGTDGVFHLAGIIHIQPGKNDLMFDVNINGVKNIMQACRELAIGRLVYTSSIHALADQPHGTVIDENTPVDPDRVFGDYGKSKAIATLAVLKEIAQGLPAVIVHPTGVIGPYDYKLSDFGISLLRIIKNPYRFYFKGGYNFADVRDVAHGIISAFDQGRIGERYILSGTYLSVKRQTEIITEFSKASGPMKEIPLPVISILSRILPFIERLQGKHPVLTPYTLAVLRSNCQISSAKAQLELGFSTRAVEVSLQDAFDWFKNNGYLA